MGPGVYGRRPQTTRRTDPLRGPSSTVARPPTIGDLADPASPGRPPAGQVATGPGRARRRTGGRARSGSSAGVDGDDEPPAPRAPLEGDAASGAPDHGDRAVTQGRLGRAEPEERPDRVTQPRLPARLVPGERATAVGVVAARQADLVAVVDARRAGQRHLEQHRQPDAGRGRRRGRSRSRGVSWLPRRLSWTATTSGS